MDRSVALVDAAMRRRFHFVPFYPDREPISEVLASVCADDEQWIAALVSAVNVELREDLGSRDHQLGASHFIQTLRTEEGFQQVWEHTIEPLIEDQMFGHEEGLEKYRWESVRHRHASIVGQTEPDALGTDVDTPDGSTP
ncbi:MAG: hypothetical protein M5U31_00300 [Acidimicrobiia bacterium]|nr:hypothetical protein [Acidimicrobiia bacterium]